MTMADRADGQRFQAVFSKTQTDELSHGAQNNPHLWMEHNPARIKDGRKLATCFNRRRGVVPVIRLAAVKARFNSTRLSSTRLDSTRHDSARFTKDSPRRFNTPARFGSVHSVQSQMIQGNFFPFRFILPFLLPLSSPCIEADLDLSKSDVTRHAPQLPLATAAIRVFFARQNGYKIKREEDQALSPGSITLEFESPLRVRRSVLANWSVHRLACYI